MSASVHTGLLTKREVAGSDDAPEVVGVVELYARFGAAIFVRCRQLLGERQAAEDATQETFLRAQKHLGRLREPAGAMRWLYTIATNICLNEIRNGRLRPQLGETLPELVTPSPQDAFVQRDLVLRLVATLAPRVSMVVWLCHVDGMSQDEAAALIGVSRRTVATRLAQFHRHAKRFVEKNRS